MNLLKKIAIMYLISGIVFLIGLYLFNQFTENQSEGLEYNQAFTFHAVIMIFLFIIPAIPAAFSKKK